MNVNNNTDLIRASDRANGRACERRMIHDSKKAGNKVTKLFFGGDFIEGRKSKKSVVVEVKYGCGPLSKTQKAAKKIVEGLGHKYEVRRCACPLPRARPTN